MLEVAGGSENGRLAAFPLATALFIAPFVLLAPFNGCVSNAMPRRWVLAGSAAFTLLAVVGFALAGGPWHVELADRSVTVGPWIACTLAVGFGAALNSAARYA